MLIILAGGIGRFPVGGHAWVDMQYLFGLRDLGHEVIYLEDCGTGSWVYQPETESITTDLGYPTSYLENCFRGTGFENSWCYRAGDTFIGLSSEAIQDACERADLFIIRASPIDEWRPEYDRPRVRVFVDSDPAFTQIKLTKRSALTSTVARCERLFSIGQRIGAPDCLIPVNDHRWIPTLAPISLPHWPATDGERTHFTTVMQWQSYPDVTYQGRSYGNKDREFPKFMDLPKHTPQPLRIALTALEPKILTDAGWEIVDGWKATFTPADYQSFVRQSRAEFAVAKHGYVMSRGGWFSDRSVCYLASGRPVLVQDTGLEDWLPIGKGVVTFTDMAEAIHGIERINSDYEEHSRVARRIAEEFFAADRVLSALLEAAVQ